MQIKISMISE